MSTSGLLRTVVDDVKKEKVGKSLSKEIFGKGFTYIYYKI